MFLWCLSIFLYRWIYSDFSVESKFRDKQKCFGKICKIEGVEICRGTLRASALGVDSRCVYTNLFNGVEVETLERVVDEPDAVEMAVLRGAVKHVQTLLKTKEENTIINQGKNRNRIRK